MALQKSCYETGHKRQNLINLTTRFSTVHGERATWPPGGYHGGTLTNQQTTAYQGTPTAGWSATSIAALCHECATLHSAPRTMTSK
jgi:hypothetical protein